MAKFIKQSETLTIRNKTNAGELCKSQFTVCGKDSRDVALVIHRLTLSTPDSAYYKAHGSLLKTYKNKALWHQVIAIRISTLQEVNSWLSTLDLGNEFK